MTQCELVLDPYGTTRYVFLSLGFLAGFLLSMYLVVFKMNKKPKLIQFDTGQGLQWLYRIGSAYYTREDYQRILKEEKPTEKFK